MTTNPQFRGVYAIPVTPFNDDLSVDWDSLRKCVEFSVEAGAHGTLDYTIKEGVNKNKIADEKILKSKK